MVGAVGAPARASVRHPGNAACGFHEVRGFSCTRGGRAPSPAALAKTQGAPIRERGLTDPPGSNIMTTGVVNIVNETELLGLTAYEGRVYRALLEDHPTTAYRLGKRSGVPLSRVYEVVAGLVRKGFVFAASERPARYAPFPPGRIVEELRRRVMGELDALADDLARRHAGGSLSGEEWARGEPAVLARLAASARQASREVQAACGSEAGPAVSEALAASTAPVHWRDLGASASREFIVLVDGTLALMGRLGAEADALCTAHPVVARLAADYFRLRGVASAAGEMLVAARPAPARGASPSGWLDWEEEKQRRLLHAH